MWEVLATDSEYSSITKGIFPDDPCLGDEQFELTGARIQSPLGQNRRAALVNASERLENQDVPGLFDLLRWMEDKLTIGSRSDNQFKHANQMAGCERSIECSDYGEVGRVYSQLEAC